MEHGRLSDQGNVRTVSSDAVVRIEFDLTHDDLSINVMLVVQLMDYFEDLLSRKWLDQCSGRKYDIMVKPEVYSNEVKGEKDSIYKNYFTYTIS